MRAVFALKPIVQVHIGNGNTRVKVGEKLEHAVEDSTREWWDDGCAEGLLSIDDQRPAHPPDLAPQQKWVFRGGGDGSVVETRYFHVRPWTCEERATVFAFCFPGRGGFSNGHPSPCRE